MLRARGAGSDGDQSVTLHDLLYLRRIGRRARGHERCKLPEIGRTKARCQHGQAACRLRRVVPEGMHRTALDEGGLAGPDRDFLAVDAKGLTAAESVDRFIPAFMIVRRRYLRVWLHGHLEQIKAARGFFLAVQELQLQAADCYFFRHRSFPPWIDCRGILRQVMSNSLGENGPTFQRGF